MNRTKLKKIKVGSDSMTAGVFAVGCLTEEPTSCEAKSGYVSPVAVCYVMITISGFISFNLIHPVHTFLDFFLFV